MRSGYKPASPGSDSTRVKAELWEAFHTLVEENQHLSTRLREDSFHMDREQHPAKLKDMWVRYWDETGHFGQHGSMRPSVVKSATETALALVESDPLGLFDPFSKDWKSCQFRIGQGIFIYHKSLCISYSVTSGQESPSRNMSFFRCL
jgi:hypothetical protein